MPELCGGVRRQASGIALIEVLVAAIIFVFVTLAFGSLYLSLSGKRGFDLTNAETFLQSQGTSIEEALMRHILRASALQVAACGSATITAGQSIIYQRQVQNPSTGVLQSESWCIYQDQRTGDPYPLLWRCQVPGLTPPQTCTANPGSSLLAGAPVLPGLALAVSNTTFAAAPVVGAIVTTVDIRFDLDLRGVSSAQSLLFGPRRFGFNTTIRN